MIVVLYCLYIYIYIYIYIMVLRKKVLTFDHNVGKVSKYIGPRSLEESERVDLKVGSVLVSRILTGNEFKSWSRKPKSTRSKC